MELHFNPAHIVLGLVGILWTVVSAMMWRSFDTFAKKLDTLTNAQIASDSRVQALEHDGKRLREIVEAIGKKMDAIATGQIINDNRVHGLEAEVKGLREWRHEQANEMQLASLLDLKRKKRATDPGPGGGEP